MLFVTNVAAILASGIVVMAFHRVHRVFGAEGFRYGGAVAIIGALLLVVIVPLWINQRVSSPYRSRDGSSYARHLRTSPRAVLLALLSSFAGEPAGPGIRCAEVDESCTSWIWEAPDCVMEGTAGNG